MLAGGSNPGAESSQSFPAVSGASQHDACTGDLPVPQAGWPLTGIFDAHSRSVQNRQSGRGFGAVGIRRSSVGQIAVFVNRWSQVRILSPDLLMCMTIQ